TSKETAKKVFLPTGDWYNLYTDQPLTGSQEITAEAPAWQIPIYVKGSSIIPMQALVQSTAQNPGDTLTVHIYNGTQPNTFTWYHDAGNGFNYRQGVFYSRTITFNPAQ